MPTIIGNCLDVLPTLESGSVNCCVTSPPYWGLRDYGTEPQLWDCDPTCDHDWNEFLRPGLSGGLDKSVAYTENQIVKPQQQQQCKKCAGWRGSFGQEPTPEMFVAHAVQIFREVRRVLRDDGTLWLNLGDSYNAYNGGAGPSSSLSRGAQTEQRPQLQSGYGLKFKGLKPKDLIGIPWRVALALQADGWYLRQDIIWHKPNPMPESVRDRCTKAHEYIFLLSKSDRYYFDGEAISEPVSLSTVDRVNQPNIENQHGCDRVPGKTIGPMKAVVKKSGNKERKPASARGVPVDTDGKTSGAVAGSVPWEGTTRNKRSVWTVTTKPFSGAHFATFPPDLIEPCILAGCPVGGMVLDPFGGSGTTGQVAESLGRQWTLIELNPEYGKLIEQRTSQIGLALA